MNGYEMETKNEVTAAIGTIMRHLNGGNKKVVADAILDTVKSDHRTLQQLFWGVMFEVQKGYATASHDMRNEDAVRLAKVIVEAAETANIGGLRYI